MSPKKKEGHKLRNFIIVLFVVGFLTLAGFVIYYQYFQKQSVITVFNDEPIDWKSTEIVLNLGNVIGLKPSNSTQAGTIDKPTIYYDKDKNMYCQTSCNGTNALTLNFGRNLNFKRIKIIQHDCKDNLVPIRIQLFRSGSLVFEKKIVDEKLPEYDTSVEKRGDTFVITCYSKENSCLTISNVEIAIIELPVSNTNPATTNIDWNGPSTKFDPKKVVKMTLSSTFGDTYTAGKCWDDNNADFCQSNNQLNAEWMADLGNNYAIKTIVLYNRQDCCKEKINPFFLILKDKNGQEVYRKRQDQTLDTYTFSDINKFAEIITVKLDGGSTLHFANLEVFYIDQQIQQ